MTKNFFIYFVLVIFVAAAVWFFWKKGERPSGFQLLYSSSPTLSSLVSSGETPYQLPNGLIIQDIRRGSGPKIESGATAVVHYTGILTNGVKFDSSYDRGQPFEFKIGARQVIQGWDQGIVGMQIGGKRKLIIPPALAYGDRGVGDVIPPNSTLIFEVELIGIEGRK